MPHTPGPWKWRSTTDEYNLVDGSGEYVLRALGDWGYDATISVSDEDARLIAQAPAMYELLKELEWSSEDHLHHATCPLCGMYSEEFHPSGGHEPDCRLAAVLKAVEGGE